MKREDEDANGVSFIELHCRFIWVVSSTLDRFFFLLFFFLQDSYTGELKLKFGLSAAATTRTES